MSYPKSGTTGDGYAWLRGLGLKVVNPVPALVPLTSAAPWVHELSGVSVDGELRIGGQRRRRPTLFTHRGLSGPGPMDCSIAVARDGERQAFLDVVPELNHEQLRAALVEGAGRVGAPRLSAVVDMPRRLREALAEQLALGRPNPCLNELSKKQRNRLVETLKALPIPITGTLGFAKAEVTAGGLALGEVDRKTLQVKKHPGLFVFGEILDVTGPIGGFNFQAAFSTAELAARAAAER